MSSKTATWDYIDFSLVEGGLLHQIWHRLNLAGHLLRLICGRVLILLALAWLPLFILALFEGTAWRAAPALPFFKDIGINLRLLVAMPLLILAETFVHRQLRPVVQQFHSRELI